MTLRDELAVVLGPGNDDRIAYAQADNVLGVLDGWAQWHDLGIAVQIAIDEVGVGPYPPDVPPWTPRS